MKPMQSHRFIIYSDIKKMNNSRFKIFENY